MSRLSKHLSREEDQCLVVGRIDLYRHLTCMTLSPGAIAGCRDCVAHIVPRRNGRLNQIVNSLEETDEQTQ